VRDAVAAVGLDCLILETDCPYLAPIPHRGKRNEPAFVTATAQKVAEVLESSAGEVAARTTRNARQIFDLG
jgi:TatD DNase family protein